MSRFIDKPSLHRIHVDVIYLLLHHAFVFDHFRVTAFLPELVFLIDFVSIFEEFQFIEHRFESKFFHAVNNLSGGKRFELSDPFSKLWTNNDGVHVILEQHIGDDVDVTTAVQERQRIQNDFCESWI